MQRNRKNFAVVRYEKKYNSSWPAFRSFHLLSCVVITRRRIFVKGVLNVEATTQLYLSTILMVVTLFLYIFSVVD